MCGVCPSERDPWPFVVKILSTPGAPGKTVGYHEYLGYRG